MERNGLRFRFVVSSAVVWLPAAVLGSLPSCAASPADPIAVCDEGTVECDSGCVDTSVDPANCGACGNACAAGQTCEAGACVGGGGDGGGGGGGGGGCAAPQTDCSGVCTDTQTDPQHCGNCAVACADGQICAGGVCQLRGCDPGLIDCDGACVNVRNDRSHCGNCVTACATGQACENGVCTCSGEFSMDLGSAVPQHVAGTTVGATDSRALSCTSAGVAEQVFKFTAPTTGTFFFDTAGSASGTAIGVLSPTTCEEIACNASGAMRTSVDLGEGESVLVVVSHTFSGPGAFTLNVDQPGIAPCTPTDIGSAVPQTQTGNTATSSNSTSASCGFQPSPDVTYTFTAPSDGRYLFVATGSGFEPAIEVLDGVSCTGPSLACDVSFGPTSRASASLTAGQAVLIDVDGYDGGAGAFTLSIDVAPPCPGADLGTTAPQTVTGNSAGLADVLSEGCAFGSGGPEATYSFTAPADGIYVFDTVGSSFDTVLSILDATCGGAEIECNDDSSGVQSQVAVALTAGQTIVVVVDANDGTGGAFTLNVSLAPPCPGLDLGSTVPQTVTGTTTGTSGVLLPLCAFGNGPEATYGFTAPADGIYSFDTLGSSYDTLLAVLDGTCGGAELACNDDTATSSQSQVFVSLVAGQTVVIAVDSNLDAGNYTLNVGAFTGGGTCASSIDLGSTVPQTVTGDSSGQPNVLFGSCGGDSAPDVVYRFTAPTAGAYTFDTAGTSHDTVLYLYDTSCPGTELDCNDDASLGVLTSSTTATLAAGQTVFIVVDGFSDSAGPYTLNVHR